METAVKQVCASCGNPLLPDGEFCLFCGDVIPKPPRPLTIVRAAPRPVLELVPRPSPVEYAGFWLRTWAGSIDIAIEAVGAIVLTVIFDIILKLTTPRFGLSPITARYVTGIAFILFLTIGGWLYCAFSESSRYRATIGKRVFGLQVVTSSGGKLSFGQATVRHFMKFLSLFTLSFGFMMAGWTRRSQALHDMPQDCLVIRVAEPSLSLFGFHA